MWRCKDEHNKLTRIFTRDCTREGRQVRTVVAPEHLGWRWHVHGQVLGTKPLHQTGVAFDYDEARTQALDTLKQTQRAVDASYQPVTTTPVWSGRRVEALLRPPLSPEDVASARSRLLQRFTRENRKLTDAEMRQLSKTERRRRRRLEREG